LSVYRFDINLRESAIVGIVGAGGIGSTLQTAFNRYDYDIASAILIIIIALVMATELASGAIRKRLQ
jgi:phosphonate transport system permease protein